MNKCISWAGLGLFLGLLSIYYSVVPVVFESLESKTERGLPVFNRIRFIPGWHRNIDLWLMQQTHQGFHKDYGDWHRLAIAVDKSIKPSRATFYELPPGSDLSFEGRPIPFQARCFACHSNGPRSIRYDGASPTVVPTLWGRAQVALWNLRIKTYGPVDSVAGGEFKDGAPFKSAYAIFSRPLGLSTCQRCHSKSRFRNELKLEHAGTAQFLVKNGFMPPFPFRITEKERQLLEKYAHSHENESPVGGRSY